MNFDNSVKKTSISFIAYSLAILTTQLLLLKKNMIVEISQETMLVFFKKEVLVLGVGFFFFFSRIKVFKLERKLIHLLKRY